MNSNASVRAQDMGEFERICVPFESMKQLSELRGTVIVELREGGIFRLELFKLRKPLSSGYNFELEKKKYMLQPGAEAVLLLVPVTDLSYGLGESIEELINSYFILKSNGLELDLQT